MLRRFSARCSAAIILNVAAIAGAGCGRHAAGEKEPSAPPTRPEIFAAIEIRAARYRMEPAFIYALVAAESNFDSRAQNGDACGLLQLKPAAWTTVSSAPFEPTVWDWRANVDAGIDYLAYSRAYLHRKNVFSYPLLLAAFHYGLDYVEERHFDLQKLPTPNNEIYRRLWAGDLSPVPLPALATGNKKPADEAAGK